MVLAVGRVNVEVEFKKEIADQTGDRHVILMTNLEAVEWLLV